MKKLKNIITLFVCFQFLAIFVLSNVSIDKNTPLIGIEFESELEHEAEGESNLKIKSKLSNLFIEQEIYSFNKLINFKPKFLPSSNSWLSHNPKVLTTPPDNC